MDSYFWYLVKYLTFLWFNKLAILFSYNFTYVLYYQWPKKYWLYVLLGYLTYLYVIHLQMGGRSNVKDELLCRFVFPERPGAIVKFLNAFTPRWNISLFHYRGQVVIPSVSWLNRFWTFHFRKTYPYVPSIGGNWCQCIGWHPSLRCWDGRVSGAST